MALFTKGISGVIIARTLRSAFCGCHTRRFTGTLPAHDINVEASLQHGGIVPQLSKEYVGVSSVIGPRRHNEDRFTISALTNNKLFLAVYDGHGGNMAVDYTMENLHKHLARKLVDAKSNDYQSLLKQSFVELNHELQQYLSVGSTGAERFSGTTAVVCLIVDSLHLHIAHVGDSRAILCRNEQSDTLTWDHHPENEQEKTRIEEKGGSILCNSIGQALVNGRLAMTRSIGDFDLKRYGVTAEPSYTYKQLKHSSDSFLALVTDGITHVMSDEAVTSTILSNRTSAQEAAEHLTQSALFNHSHDNVTAVILPLGAWNKELEQATQPKQNFMRFRMRD